MFVFFTPGTNTKRLSEKTGGKATALRRIRRGEAATNEEKVWQNSRTETRAGIDVCDIPPSVGKRLKKQFRS